MASYAVCCRFLAFICLHFLVFVCVSEGAAELKHKHKHRQDGGYRPGPVQATEIDLLEFPLNLEYLEAEFFLFGAFGYGLDQVAPELVSGGPPPTGAVKAHLDPLVQDVIKQFAYQEVGHLRAIKATVKGFPRPHLDLSAQQFAKVFDTAFHTKLNPPFDPYANSVNYLLASYVIPYVGLTGYVGANAHLRSKTAKRLLAGLLGVESGQDAVIRTLLYRIKDEKVAPYKYTVAEFTDRLSTLRNQLGYTRTVDEGLVVKKSLGAEGMVEGNILAGDKYSVAYGRNPAQILRIVYSSGNESIPGGIFPHGGGGNIAKGFLSPLTPHRDLID
ncbi:ferritin-like catalase Nec2 [Cryptomeria japonica]|uniref:ferritin-like catalase Nec2 n=1 Tax=Cryptomeria japonica TaxID=3369 RepID=UPI0025AC3741|nr:ferritin-like catalase Nec2 [Cryptomeria japonica]